MKFSEIRKRRFLAVAISLSMLAQGMSPLGISAAQEEDSYVQEDAAGQEETADTAEGETGADPDGAAEAAAESGYVSGEEDTGLDTSAGSTEEGSEASSEQTRDGAEAISGASETVQAWEADPEAADFEEVKEAEEELVSEDGSSSEDMDVSKTPGEAVSFSQKSSLISHGVASSVNENGVRISASLVSYKTVNDKEMPPAAAVPDESYAPVISASGEEDVTGALDEEDVLGGSEEKTYNPTRPGIVMVPDSFMSDTNFFLNNIRGGNLGLTKQMTVTDSSKNMIYVTGGKGNISSGDKGGSGIAVKRSKNGEQCKYILTYSLDNSYLKERMNEGDLRAYAEANLYSDYHKNYRGHNSTGKARWGLINMTLYLSYQGSRVGVTSKDEKDEEPQQTKISLDMDSYYGSPALNLSFENTVCQCGDNRIDSIIVNVTDKNAPRSSRVWVARKSGNSYVKESTGFKPGERGYIVIDTNEAIRFAGNEWQDLKLQLNCIRSKNDQSTKEKVEASLVSLEGKRMVFGFDVPQTIDDIATDVYFSSFSFVDNWANNQHQLVFVDKNGDTVNGVTEKCTSAVTDLAGNPLNADFISTRTDKIRLDGVAPTAAGIRIDSSLETGAELSAANVYAGVGDRIGYTLYFDEQVTGFDTKNVKAVLNLLDKDGKKVELSVASVGKVSGKKVNGVDAGSRDVTYIVFNDLVVTEDMTPAVGNNEDVTIVSVAGMDSATDMSGNKLGSMGSIDLIAGKQFHLDNIAPGFSVGTPSVGSSSAYGSNPVFTVPLKVADAGDSSRRQTQISGTENLTAQLSLKVPSMAGAQAAPIYCYVDSLAAIDDTKWQTMTLTDGAIDVGSFSQMGESAYSYVHIMLDRNTDYGYSYDGKNDPEFKCELTVTGSDHAGNMAQGVLAVSCDGTDKVQPELRFLGTAYNNESGSTSSGTISVTLEAADNLRLKNIKYQWGNGSLEQVNDKDIDKANHAFDLTSPVYSGGGKVTLKVTAIDYKENTKEFSTDIEYDFTTPGAKYWFDGGSFSDPQAKPFLTVNDPGSNTSGAFNTFVVFPADEGCYVKKLYNKDVFSENSGWYRRTVTGTVGGESFTLGNAGTQADDSEIESYIGSRFGETKLYLCTTHSNNGTGADSVSLSSSNSVVIELAACLMGTGIAVPDMSFGDSLNVLAGTGTGSYSEENVFTGSNAIDVEDSDWDSTNKQWTKDSNFRPVASLGDYAFPVTISMKKDGNNEEIYGFNTLRSLGYELQYYNRRSGSTKYTFGKVYGGTLATDSGSQLISISANAVSTPGWYRIVLVAETRDGKTYRQQSGNMYINSGRKLDLNENGEVGIHDYRRSFDNIKYKGRSLVDDGYAQELKKYDSGEAVLKVGMTTGSIDGISNEKNYFKFFFRINTGEEIKGVEDNYKYRIFSSRDETVSDNSLWQPLEKWSSDQSGRTLIAHNDINREIAVTVSDNIVPTDYTRDGEFITNLPLAEGANVILFQVMDNTGTIHEVHRFTVDASTDVPLMDFESEKIIGSRGKPVAENVWPVFSPAVAPTVTACATVISNNPVSETDPYSFIKAEDREIFYAMNSYGNISTASYTSAADVDGEAPEFVKIVSTSYESTGRMPSDYDDDYNTGLEGKSNPLGFYLFIYSGGEEDKNLDASQFYMTFDREYSKLLTGKDEPLTFNLPVGKALGGGAYGEWTEYEDNVYGIYHTKAHGTKGKDVGLEVWGQFKYDPDLGYKEDEYGNPDQSCIRNITVSINAIDDWGNASSFTKYGTIEMEKINCYPMAKLGLFETVDFSSYGSIQPMTTEDGMLYVTAGIGKAGTGSPIVVKSISYNGYSNTERAAVHDGLDAWNYEGNTYNYRSTPCYTIIPFEGRGTDCSFAITDLFDQTFESTLDLSSMYEAYGLAVFEKKPAGITNSDVTVSVSINNTGFDIDNDGKGNDEIDILELYGMTEEGKRIEGSVSGNNGTVVMPSNGTVTVATHYDHTWNSSYAYNENIYFQSVSVNNIDKELEPLKIVYSGELDNSLICSQSQDGTISGTAPALSSQRIAARVSGIEELLPADGEGVLEYIFPYNSKKGDEYTFNVKDIAGNTGSITAVCPCDIEDLELLPLSVSYSYKDGTPVSANGVSSNRVVIAAVECGEPLIEIDENGDEVEGGTCTHTFRYGSKAGDEYVIYVKDNAGNTGSIKAVCPFDIEKMAPAEPEYIFEDGTPFEMPQDEMSEISVTARIVSSNMISASSRGEMSHTFEPGSMKGDTVTLYYQDVDGNECTVSAVCPCDIIDTTDRVAPDYRIVLMPMRGGRYSESAFDEITGTASSNDTAAGRTISENLSDNGAGDPYVAQAYRLTVTGEDESAPVAIFIKKAGAQAGPEGTLSSDEIPGVSCSYYERRSAMDIDIVKGAAFDLYLRDAAGNVTAIRGIEIKDECFAYEAPSVNAVPMSMQYDPVEKMRYTDVYFLPDPDRALLFDSKSVTQLEGGYTDGAGRTWKHAYAARYTKNGSDTLTYRDEAGNISSVAFTVSNIDNSAIVVKDVKWMGTSPAGMQPDKSGAVGTDVAAVMTTTKTIGEAELFDAQTGDAVSGNDAVSIEFFGNTVTVRYSESYDRMLTVRITSLTNQAVTEKTLPAVTCIDKTPPVITDAITSQASGDKSYITLSFTTDEPAIVNEFIKKKNGAPDYGTEHAVIISGKETTAITLSDRQGNVSGTFDISEHLEKIDNTKLELEFSFEEGHSDAVADAAQLPMHDQGDTVYIRPSKAASLTIAGTTKEAEAGSWQSFTIPDLPVCQVGAEDANTGIVRYFSFTVLPKDRVAPVISFDRNALVLTDDASYEDMETLLKSGISILDERDGEIDASKAEISGMPETVMGGLYSISYSVSDHAGNRGRATRTLYIMAKGGFMVYADGEAGIPDSTIIVTGTTCTLTFDDPSSGDILIKNSPGTKTMAQMKYASGFRTGTKKAVITGLAKGFNTVYVRNQEREQIRFKIFVN